jgi:hypothetical protein
MKVRNFLVMFFVVAIMAAFSQTAMAQTTVVVTPDDVTRQAEDTLPTDSWVLYTRAGTPTSAAMFRQGPGTPPSGIGSIQFTTTTGSEKVFLFNFDQVEKTLAGIDAMSYETYRTAGNLQQVTALNMVIDFNGPNVAGGFSTLVFEPVYNTTQGAVMSDIWQEWDAYNDGQAIWWSTRALDGGICASSCYVTWDQIVDANPNATIKGGFGFNQGSGNTGLTSAVDSLVFGYNGSSVLYDFEPYLVATTKASCKGDGWTKLRRADG